MAQRMVKCELCDENKDGTWFCKNCHQSLCDKCKKSHQRANVSKHHDIISRNDMFETQGEKARPVDEYCKDHTKEIYILFCKKCNVLICRKCLTEKHSKHDVTEIENVFNENRRKAEKLVRELSMEEGHSDSDGKSDEHEQLRNKIQEKAEKLKDDVDNAKEEMLSELNDIFGELTKNQSAKEEALKKLNISLQSNRSSELLDAVGFSLSLQSSIAEDERDSSGIQYLPGQYSLSDVQHLLGTISTTKPLKPAYVLSYMELNTKSMILSYQYPMKSISEVNVAQLKGTKPFSGSLTYFSIEIKNVGEQGLIAIGIAPDDHDSDRYPGWDDLSFGYHADDGGIFTGVSTSNDKEDSRQCSEGDVMGCSFNTQSRMIEFYKNGRQVWKRRLGLFPVGVKFYPVISMGTPGEAILLREKDPWFV